MKTAYEIRVEVANVLIDRGLHLDVFSERIRHAYPEAEVSVSFSMYQHKTIVTVGGYPYPGDAERRVLDGAQRIVRNATPAGIVVSGRLALGFN